MFLHILLLKKNYFIKIGILNDTQTKVSRFIELIVRQLKSKLLILIKVLNYNVEKDNFMLQNEKEKYENKSKLVIKIK